MKLIVILFTFLGISAKTQEGDFKKQNLSKTNEIKKVKPSCQELGEELYLKHCSICHGRHGDGKGILHDSMTPKPTNFQKQTYFKKDSQKDLAYIIEILKKGIPQTSMAKFTHILKTQEALECTSKYVQKFKKEKN